MANNKALSLTLLLGATVDAALAAAQAENARLQSAREAEQAELELERQVEVSRALAQRRRRIDRLLALAGVVSPVAAVVAALCWGGFSFAAWLDINSSGVRSTHPSNIAAMEADQSHADASLNWMVILIVTSIAIWVGSAIYSAKSGRSSDAG